MKTTAKQYAQTLYELTEGKSQSEIEKAVADFADYIYRNRKLKLADKIIEQFEKLYNRQKGIVEAEIVSREKFDAEQEKKLQSFVKEKYQAREVILKNVIDEKVKGGLIIRVDDEVMDGSVKGQLEKLRNILIS